MFDIILVGIVLLALYRKISFIISKRKNFEKIPILKGANSFFIKKGKVGVLFIHGFTSTPQEFGKFGSYLSKKNITIYCPLLKGHGTSPEHMSTTNWKDWCNDAEKALIELKKSCNKVYVIGNSMGGNIAMILSSKHSLDGIVLLGTPMFFKRHRLLRTLLQLYARLQRYQKKMYPKNIDKKIFQGKVHYDRIPLNNTFDLFKIIKESKKILPEITCPTLIMQSSSDYIIKQDNAQFIYNNIKSKIKDIVFIPPSYHVFIVDRYKKKAFDESYNFIMKTKDL